MRYKPVHAWFSVSQKTRVLVFSTRFFPVRFVTGKTTHHTEQAYVFIYSVATPEKEILHRKRLRLSEHSPRRFRQRSGYDNHRRNECGADCTV